MTISTGHIVRRRADTKPVRVCVKDLVGSAEDIASATFKLTVGTEPYPTSSGTELFTVVGVIYGPTADGIVDFAITGGNEIHVGFYYFEVEMIDPAGLTDTIIFGWYEVKQDKTKTLPAAEWEWVWDNGSGKGEPIDPLVDDDWVYGPHTNYGSYPAYGAAEYPLLSGFYRPTLMLEAYFTTFPVTISHMTSIFGDGPLNPIPPTASLELEVTAYANVSSNVNMWMGFSAGAGSVDTGIRMQVMWEPYFSAVPKFYRPAGQVINTGHQAWSSLQIANVSDGGVWLTAKLQIDRENNYVRGKIWEDGQLEPDYQPGWEYNDIWLYELPTLHPFIWVTTPYNNVAIVHVSKVTVRVL